MSIDDTLTERISQLSADVQGGPSLQRALQQGRTRRRRRTAAAVGSGVATVCAVGGVAVAAITGNGFTGGGSAEEVAATWTVAAPPEEMPSLIEDSVRDQLPAGAEVTGVQISAYAEGDYPYAAPKPKPLPRPDWDRAASWVTAFELGDGQTIRVAVLPHDPETEELADDFEAGLRKYCHEATLAGDLSCEYDEPSNGMYVTRKETVLRRVAHPSPSWAKGDVLSGVDPAAVKHRDEVWFDRSVEAAPGSAYSVRVDDEVNVPEYEQAEARWLDMDALERIATDDDLLEQPGS
ncbi:hypothetical protein [Solicola gregarius]|uniref:Uncharacterized protein n=1 Tax=Solicola gregarius TaxID=2908642 RepID=A0AA46TKZ5_9ACTN|nr:hypothetical protein [Solicola gregarius]UYM07206.1 hypothetical protein L0C25_09060 [Solicola gregarius]